MRTIFIRICSPTTLHTVFCTLALYADSHPLAPASSSVMHPAHFSSSDLHPYDYQHILDTLDQFIAKLDAQDAESLEAIQLAQSLAATISPVRFFLFPPPELVCVSISPRPHLLGHGFTKHTRSSAPRRDRRDRSLAYVQARRQRKSSRSRHPRDRKQCPDASYYEAAAEARAGTRLALGECSAKTSQHPPSSPGSPPSPVRLMPSYIRRWTGDAKSSRT